MSFDEFTTSVRNGASAPSGLSGALVALWLDARGEWDRAHEAAHSDPGAHGAWVHAYLHRKEGDRGNAGYWYARAGRPMPAASASFTEEWADIAKALLG